MIRLEITDNATGEVLVPHLSASLSFEMVRENPLFDLRGDYTYDIDISLRDPHNRAIYRHIERLTSASRPQNRRARLLADGHLVADGTEVILKKDGETLKVQLLAGNSEMNYLTAPDNLRVREMDFGSIETPTAEVASENAYKVYPEVNYTFPPIFRNSTDDAFDNAVFGNLYGSVVVYESSENLWPQPFVLYYVRKFVELLGYQLTYSSLEQDARWRSLILVSGYKTLEYAKMLPDWKASEFLIQIERFFNCRFIVTGKDVQIVKASTYRQTTQKIEIQDSAILDEFLRDYEDHTEDFFAPTKNMSYELPGGAYWAYMHLQDDVRKRCTNLSMPLSEAKRSEDPDWHIFRSTVSGLTFIRSRSAEGDDTRHFRSIDHFAPHVENPGIGQTTLKIIPCEIRAEETAFQQKYMDHEMPMYESGLCLCPMPQFYETKENNDFGAAVEDGISDQAGSVMQVAFYLGPQRLRLSSEDEVGRKGSICWIPQCMTVPKIIIDGYIEVAASECRITDGKAYTLELNGPDGLFERDYKETSRLALDQQHTIRFQSPELLDPTRLFLIHGCLFVCQQLKYTYQDGRQHPIVEGVFYPYYNTRA